MKKNKTGDWEKKIVKVLGWGRNRGHWEDSEGYDMTDVLKELLTLFEEQKQEIIQMGEEILTDLQNRERSMDPFDAISDYQERIKNGS